MRPIEERIAFKPVTRSDLPLLSRWLEEPHMRDWWGEPDEEVALIRDMVEGRDATRPFVFQLDGQPLGYIQYWFLGEVQTEDWLADRPWLASFPADAVGLDLSIGEPGWVGRGLGPIVARCFALRLYRSGYPVIIVDPDPDNHRAIRAYEKAGFRISTSLAGMDEDALVMQFQTDHEEL